MSAYWWLVQYNSEPQYVHVDTLDGELVATDSKSFSLDDRTLFAELEPCLPLGCVVYTQDKVTREVEYWQTVYTQDKVTREVEYWQTVSNPPTIFNWDAVVIGQECVCPDGLGRVEAVEPADNWLMIRTYVNNRNLKWAPDDVKLVKLNYV